MAPRKAKNTNRQGANFELQIMAYLRERGYDVLRSSGSRGAVDVVAVGDFHVLMIQAKITNPVISPAERSAVRAIARRADAVPLVAHRDNGSVLFRELTGDGPKEFEHFEPMTHGWVDCECRHTYRNHHTIDEPSCATCTVCPGFTFPKKESKS